MKIPHWPIYTGPNKDFINTIPRMKYILSKLDNPHVKLKNVIHITGTKGKGSTALYIANILTSCGYKVNTYISPHIYECNERILLNNKPISDNDLYEATETVRFICEENIDKNNKNNNKNNLIEPSMFEALTCSAFYAMAQNNADFNVIEVGMGAIYDATNVFDDNPPIVCVFTPIHLDHVKFLGNNIQKVALNKSFLIKKGTQYVVMASQSTEAKNIITDVAKNLQIPNIVCYNQDYEVFYDLNKIPVYESKFFDTCFQFQTPNMAGDYQLINAGCAISVCLACQKNKTCNLLTLEAINNGIKNTLNIVRMQLITNGTLFSKLPSGSIFYVDGAHNQLAAHALATWIKEFKKKNTQSQNDYKICVAIARTKGANNKVFIQELLENKKPIIDLLIATRANLESIPEPPEIIAETAQQLGFICKTAYNIDDVINHCIYWQKPDTPMKQQNQKILLICTGSLYIARDIAIANKT